MYSCTLSARYCRLAFGGKQPKGCVHNDRVESSPIQSSQAHKDAAVALVYLQWPPRQCVYISRVESSPTSLAESRVLIPHVSFPSVRLQLSGLKEEMDSNSFGRINNLHRILRATKHDLVKKIGKLHYSVIVFILCH